MQEKLIELVPLIVVLTGVVASIFAYRQAERQNRPTPPGLVAVGGALASQEAAKIHAEEIQKLAASIDRLAESQFAVAKATRESASRWKDFLDETEHIRRALQDIAAVQRSPRH